MVLLTTGHDLVTGLVIGLALLVVEDLGNAPAQGPGIGTVPRAIAGPAVTQEVGLRQPGTVLGIVPAPVANPRRRREMIEIIGLVPTTLGRSLEVPHVNVTILLLPRNSKALLRLRKRCDLGVLHPSKMDMMNEPSFDTCLLLHSAFFKFLTLFDAHCNCHVTYLFAVALVNLIPSGRPGNEVLSHGLFMFYGMDAEEGGQLLGPEKGADSAVVVSTRSKAEHYSWACLWAEIKSVFNIWQLFGGQGAWVYSCCMDVYTKLIMVSLELKGPPLLIH